MLYLRLFKYKRYIQIRLTRILPNPIRVRRHARRHARIAIGARRPKRNDAHQIDDAAGVQKERTARVALARVASLRVRANVAGADAAGKGGRAALLADDLQPGLLQRAGDLAGKLVGAPADRFDPLVLELVVAVWGGNVKI